MQTQTRDVVDIIRDQHSTIRRLFAEVTSAAPDRRGDAFQPLVRLLAVHETAEEEVVYPAIMKLGDDGATVAEERRAEEDQAKKVLAELEDLDASTVDFMVAFAAFEDDVEEHAQSEESTVLPLLLACTLDERSTMGEAFQAAEALAPTHAHRLAPESGIGNMLVGPFVAMVDRVRDAIHDATHDATR